MVLRLRWKIGFYAEQGLVAEYTQNHENYDTVDTEWHRYKGWSIFADWSVFWWIQRELIAERWE